jgi:NADH-quinone oxidoreductase subunit J
MPIQSILFYALSILTLLCAAGVIFSKTPIYSILSLILTFFCITGHYVLLNAQFLGIVNIVVYAGAIMVLFLFVVMLMNLNGDTEPQKSRIVQTAAVIGGGGLLVVLVAVLKAYGLQTGGTFTQQQSNIGLVHHLGKILFKDYVLPFEISSILFLSAMIGAVVIGKKDATDVLPESQSLTQQ